MPHSTALPQGAAPQAPPAAGQRPAPRLAVARATPASILDDYQHILGLLRLGEAIGAAPWVLVPAAERPLPFPAANTPPWQLEGAIVALRSAGARDISVCAAGGDIAGLAFADVCARLRAPILAAPAEIPRGAAVLLLPTLRRGPAALTGACALALRFHAFLSGSYGPAAPAIAGLLQRAPYVAAVMDATTVGNGAAFSADQPEIGNMLLASADIVALDSLAARLLCIDAGQLPVLGQLEQHKLGCTDVDAADLAGDRSLLDQRWRPLRAQGIVRLARSLGRARAERELYTSWLDHTAWGRLFASYYRGRLAERLAPGARGTRP